MQIACPQCSMKYDLDERLLPPGGAPVQCTRCGHVFTAQAPGRAPATAGAPRPAPQGEPAPAVRRQTLVFGGSAGEGKPPPARSGTQVFGAAPGGASTGARSGTQVFGAPAEPPAGRSGTQVFGAAPPTDGPTPGRGGTQVFGAAPPARPEAPARSGTQVFGAAPASPGRGGTQVFGAPPAAAEPPARSGTQVFGAAPPAEPAASPPPRSGTQVFGAPPAARPGRGGTQVFGAQPPAPRAGTLQFGTVTPEEAAAEPTVRDGPVYGRPAAAPPATGTGPDTLPFGEPVVRPGASPVAPPPPLSRFEPPSLERPERPSAPPDLGEPSRGWLRWVVLAAALLALALAAAAWARRARASAQESSREEALRQDVLALLRKDDTASQEEAVRRLRARVASAPEDVGARADLALALAFRWDDAQLAARLLETRRLELQRREASLRAAQTPADWEGRATALSEERARLESTLVPLRQQADALGAELASVRAALETQRAPAEPSATLALARGRALAAAVQEGQGALAAHTPGLERAEGGAPWLALAQAQAALRAPGDRSLGASAAAALAPLREQDRTFVRPYVLGARLALALDDAHGALALLEAATTFNPRHGLARQLADVARASR